MSFSTHAKDEVSGDVENWNRIQKTTFTRWANQQLSRSTSASTSRIVDLQKDLSDGVLLIALVEALSGSRVPGSSNLKATFRTQKLESVTVCLDYLQYDQGVKIVNIGSCDIVDGNLKLILGLLWTLVVYYSISSKDSGLPPAQPGSTMTSARQRLMAWINDRLPDDRKVKNFNGDWKNGKTLAALVNSFDPGLCGDWSQWSDSDCVRNTETAMQVAIQSLNIAELMTAEEMCDEDSDEHSIMTYLSQFPNATLNKAGVTVRPKQPSVDSGSVQNTMRTLRPEHELASKASVVTATGDGLTDGYVGYPARFRVTSTQLKLPSIQVSIDGPAKVKRLTRQDNGDRYDFEYVTTVAGRYLITILYEGEFPIPGSPFKANFAKLDTAVYDVNVYTSHVFGAGTDSNVHVVLFGEIGDTGRIPLTSSKTHKNKFERGQHDEFTVVTNDVGDLRKIRIGHDGAGAGADWHLDSVVITLLSLRRKWTFNHNQWLGKESPGGLVHEILPTKSV